MAAMLDGNKHLLIEHEEQLALDRITSEILQMAEKYEILLIIFVFHAN